MNKNKLFWFITLILSATISLSSCGGGGDDDDDIGTSDNNTSKAEDHYYIKYKVTNGKMISYSSYTDRTITYTTPTGSQTTEVRSVDWEETYGPFRKGDFVSLSVSAVNARNTTNASISVCKNSEPFAVKAEKSNEDSKIYLIYTIDY